VGTNSAQKRLHALLPGRPGTRNSGNQEQPPPVGAAWSEHRKRVGSMCGQVAPGGGKGRHAITPHSRCVQENMEAHLRCRVVRQLEECLTLIAGGSDRLAARWFVGEPKEGNRHRTTMRQGHRLKSITIIAGVSDRPTARCLVGEPKEGNRHRTMRKGHGEKARRGIGQGDEDHDERYAFSLHSLDTRQPTNARTDRRGRPMMAQLESGALRPRSVQ